jgi:hypothetical protein
LYADWLIRKRHEQSLHHIRNGFLEVMTRARRQYTASEIKVTDFEKAHLN